MPDIFTPEKRSEVMSKIKSKGTKIELRLKERLEREGIEFEYQPKMRGHPDFLIHPNIVVFCDGSFWHGRDWEYLKQKLAEGYWRDHIGGNVARDKRITEELENDGMVVLRFWDREIEKNLDVCISILRYNMAKYK